MKLFHRPQQLALLLSALMLTTILLTACTGVNTGTGNSTGSTTNTYGPQGNGGKGCTRIGILLPDINASATRWEAKDHPLLVQAVKSAIPGVQIDYTNAQDSADTQLSQAQADLAKGDCILIVAAHDSIAAASIVTRARAQNVPVIAYDRLIQSKDTSYYVSFDNVAVGRLQGQYIASHYQQFMRNGDIPNVSIISGSQTDTNALLFSQGLHEVLDPMFADGTLKNAYETFTPDWNSATAQTEMEVALGSTTPAQNNIEVAYVANDDMAQTAISALKTANLAGKVLVTGQDATADAIHSILLGNQSMTVYKPIAKEAESAGKLVAALYQGASITSLTGGATTPTFDGGNIPSVLDTPIAVGGTNIASTVIADQFVVKSDVCNGIPAGTDGVC